MIHLVLFLSEFMQSLIFFSGSGNYGKWMKNTTCNVTCGDGFEMWTRKCESPTPAYGGHNCSKRGEGEKWKSCRKTPCKYVLTGILN